MVVKLVSASGEETQLNVGVEISIGRDKKTCKVLLPISAEGVSRKHASLLLSGEGVLTLTDMSSFGTFINGTNVNKAKKNLKDGDQIRIGESYFSISKKQPTSPALLVKPVDFKQPYKKNATPKAKKATVATESQRKMSDFFRPSQSARSTLVLADETPQSQLAKSSPTGSWSFVKDTAKSYDLNPEIVIDDDEDDFCLTLSAMKTKQEKSVPVLKTTRVPSKPKSSLFSRNPTQRTFMVDDDSLQVLAADTLDFKDSYSKENNLLQKNEVVVDTMIGWGETKNATLASDTCTSPNAITNKTTNSMLYPGFPSSFAQPEARKGVKRSVLYPMRNEAVSNISSIPLAPTEPPPKRKSFLTMPTMVDDAVYEETTMLTDSSVSIFDTKEKPSSQKPKRGRKPIVEPKEDEENFSVASFTPNRELLNSIYSGEKYEELDEEEESKHDTKPKFRKIEVQSVIDKMDNMVLFVDITRSEASTSQSKLSNVSSFTSRNYSTCSSQVNFKRFKKASQGKFNNTRKSISIVGGSSDLVDFRSI